MLDLTRSQSPDGSIRRVTCIVGDDRNEYTLTDGVLTKTESTMSGGWCSVHDKTIDITREEFEALWARARDIGDLIITTTTTVSLADPGPPSFFVYNDARELVLHMPNMNEPIVDIGGMVTLDLATGGLDYHGSTGQVIDAMAAAIRVWCQVNVNIYKRGF